MFETVRGLAASYLSDECRPVCVCRRQSPIAVIRDIHMRCALDQNSFKWQVKVVAFEFA